MKLSTYFLASLCLIFLTACGSSKEGTQMDHAYTNQLIHTNSPYLLQHAHNPVDWYPWGDEALAKAKEENKMLLVSIGYSACHWCHVMEHESFEDTTVARIMNEHFVNIKIDREERPDIDAIYMTACQMSSETSCGWPLNSFALPDGRPVWSGTYFPKKQWIEILEYFIDIREKTPEKLEEFGDKLAAGMQSLEEIKPVENVQAFTPAAAAQPIQQFLDNLDNRYGGRQGVQKFPMPSNYEWLLQYYLRTGKEEALNAAQLTLDQMANGGIYDHVGGGFSRYTTDTRWRVPHFEKMLYDNSQLVSLYAKAFQVTQHAPYRETLEETLRFIARELSHPDGGFYSSLDADSEGEEGKFYVWTQAEIDSILSPTEAPLAIKYYEVSKRGNWEEGKNILRIEKDLEEVAKGLSIDPTEAKSMITSIKEKLLAARAGRVRPGLDDKILTSWNALMLKGYVDAFKATTKEEYRQVALRNGEFLSKHMLQPDFRLQRNFKDGSTSINGFLEDYAHTIAAFTALYEITFDESWLQKAKGLADYSMTHFQDEKSGFFFYTSDLDPPLLVRKIELSDKAIPASNSAMARSLLHLGHYFYDKPYLEIAENMMQGMREKALEGESASFYSNWNQLYLELANPIYEVAIVGQSFDELRQEIQSQYFPQAVYLGGADEGSLALLDSKLVEDETFVYVCLNKVCKLPVSSATEAKALIK